MGVCCTKIKTQTNQQKEENNSLTVKQQQEIIPQARPITLDQINKSIDEWKEITKRRKVKLQEEIKPTEENNLIQIEIDEIDNKNMDKELNNIETSQQNDLSGFDDTKMINDFNNNHKLIKGFSEQSSTLHFTGLNSKDFISSKFVHKPNFGSQSLYNILMEMEANNENKFISLPRLKFSTKIGTSQNNKIFIQNNAFFPIKDKSVSIIEKTLITVKKKENDKVESVRRNLYNSKRNMSSFDMNSNDDATILSDNALEDSNFNQDDIFYNVEKLVFGTKRRSSADIVLKFASTINNVPILVWNKRKRIPYTNLPEEILGVKLIWKKKSYGIETEIEEIKINKGIFDTSSLLAAIVSIINYDNMFKTKLFDSIIFCEEKLSVYSIRLHFNGCFRAMELEDTFPNDLFSTCNSSYYELMINLIEKAIFLLYNSDGFKLRSNSAIEIYHLTGWIPEVYVFNDMNNQSNLWTRLYENFFEGNVILCLGTENNKQGLSNNNLNNTIYSVIELKEEGGTQMLKCKSPCELKESNNFWFDFDKIKANFTHMYVAWNPTIYPFKYNFASTWKNHSGSKSYDDHYCLEHNPQFVITISEHKEDFEMRVLLTKHISKLDNNVNFRKTISFKLFWYDGYPIIYPLGQLRALSNPKREVGSDVFIFEASDQIEQYVLVTIKNDNADDIDEEIGYSLDFFSFVEVEIKEVPKREILRSYRVIDDWKNASPQLRTTYRHNPQFKISLLIKQHIQIKLETLILAPVSLLVVKGGIHSAHTDSDDIKTAIGPKLFFKSYCHFECVLDPGDYTIICLTEYDRDIGKFSLEANSLSHKEEFYLQRIYCDQI